MISWEIEWEATARGTANVEAPDEETARQIAETGHGVEIDNVDELSDWKVVNLEMFRREGP